MIPNQNGKNQNNEWQKWQISSPPPIKTCFLSILHQNKALYNLHRRGQGPESGPCFCLDEGLSISGGSLEEM